MHNKLTRLGLIAILISFNIVSFAQSIIIQKGIRLPEDTVIAKQLISSLNGLLSEKEKPNNSNPFVLKDDLLETSALLDELKEMEQNAVVKDKNFFKCYLGNVIKQRDGRFIVQISYIGIQKDKPVLRAVFNLLARQAGDKFYFSSPLKQNTRYWKTKQLNSITYHYKDTLSKTDTKAYKKTIDFYDEKLKAPFLPIQFYYCDNFTEVQQLLGIEYKADYNGFIYDVLIAHENGMDLNINGWNSSQHRFDPHDLWHERLRAVVNSDIINRPVDEGCAYLYGGSWGFTWPELLTKFKKYAEANPNADWLTLYLNGTNFSGGEKILKVSYALNALIAQKIEKEKGFAPVLDLLKCGKRETGDANYFTALEKITGINKTNFNTMMWELIKK